MKPFDLEAAKRGEPICTEFGNARYFIGARKNGGILVEDELNWLYSLSADSLRMAPKKRTVWATDCYIFASEADAKRGKAAGFLSKAYPVEIEE